MPYGHIVDHLGEPYMSLHVSLKEKRQSMLRSMIQICNPNILKPETGYHVWNNPELDIDTTSHRTGKWESIQIYGREPTRREVNIWVTCASRLSSHLKLEKTRHGVSLTASTGRKTSLKPTFYPIKFTSDFCDLTNYIRLGLYYCGPLSLW